MNFTQFLDDDAEKQISNVYCMELVDENPESKQTMAQIAEDLTDTFGKGSQQGWVMLAGDGKTYKRLMSIKNQYGSALQKLILLGDWHRLKELSASANESSLSCWLARTGQVIWLPWNNTQIPRNMF